MFKAILNSKLPKHTLRESGAGFTLVELLVVIAIIGILSSVAVISLSSAKQKARNAVVLRQLDDLQAVIYVCLDSGYDLLCDNAPVPGEGNNCNDESGVPTPPDNGIGAEGPVEICQNASTFWPNLQEHSWAYSTPFTYDKNDRTWTISAVANDLPGIPMMTCTQTGCTTTGL